MKKMRFCSVCKAYTLEKIHCSRLSISAHPVPFNPSDVYGDYRRAIKGINMFTKGRYAI